MLICIFCSEGTLKCESGGDFKDLSIRDIPADKLKSVGAKAMESLKWLCGRYLEICLFRYLQNAANNPAENDADQKAYIYCILSFLVASGPANGNALASDSVGRSPGKAPVFTSANTPA